MPLLAGRPLGKRETPSLQARLVEPCGHPDRSERVVRVSLTNAWESEFAFLVHSDHKKRLRGVVPRNVPDLPESVWNRTKEFAPPCALLIRVRSKDAEVERPEFRVPRIEEAAELADGRNVSRPLHLEDSHRVIAQQEERIALSDRKSTRLNSSHIQKSRMPSSA